MPSDKASRGRLTDKARTEVWAILGHECALAGVDGEECDGPLEVDHMYGRDYLPRRLNIYNRWRRYLREAKAGVVRGLCRAHNERVRPRRGAVTLPTSGPF